MTTRLAVCLQYLAAGKLRELARLRMSRSKPVPWSR
jgi:hypothetical protein